MNYWRMAFREGPGGYDMWPACFSKGIAAIGYTDEDYIPIVKDCRHLTREQFREIWREKCPRSGSAQASLAMFAYEMEERDVIYAKDGKEIVGRGTVGKYRYDPGCLGRQGWEHVRKVKWEQDFPRFECDLGAWQWTVLRLDEARLAMIRQAEGKAGWKRRGARPQSSVKLPTDALPEELTLTEGKTRQFLVKHRVRERRLRKAKILKVLAEHCGKLRCEVPGCEFDFHEAYGDLGEGYAHVHHRKPLGRSKGTVKTSLDDLAIVCANCHAMIHKNGKCRDFKGLIKRPRKGR